MRAAERFAAGDKTADIAAGLRVGVRQVEKWRSAWRHGGIEALRSKGHPGTPERLSCEQWARLEAELERGPLAHGFDDQHWTPARVKTLIGRMFHLSYTEPGVWYLLKRHGWSCQVPARRAIEHGRRGDQGVAQPGVAAPGSAAAAEGAWLVFEDESGRSLRPPKARTWGRRGCTPVVAVPGGRGRGKVTTAAPACYRPGHRSRLIWRQHVWRQHVWRRRKGEAKSFSWRGYRDLLIAAHHQLPGGKIVLVWDNLSVHRDRRMRRFIDRTDWLTVVQLPAYAPEPNPVEGIWSVINGTVLANLAATGSTMSSPCSGAASSACSTGPRSSTAVWPRPD